MVAMGWDGYARPEPKGDALEAFRLAATSIKERCGSVDWLLERGALDCSDCAEWMEKLSGASAWADWSAAEMADFAASADRNAVHEEYQAEQKDAWARESALAFMRVCAQQRRGMRVCY